MPWRFLFAFILIFNLQMHAAHAVGPACEDAFTEEDIYRVSLPIPNFMRFGKATSHLRSILKEWKAASPKAISLASLKGAQELRDLGVKYVPAMIPDGGLEITPEMLPKSALVTFYATALTHPRMKTILEKMNADGYHLYIDPSLAVKDDYSIVFGSYRAATKTIRLLPNANWDVFIHEYQHLNFDRMGFRDVNFVFENQVLPPEAQKIAKKIYKMKKQGFSNLAIDETLAVDEEVKALYRMGYTPMSFAVYKAKSYAWDHQIKGLVLQGLDPVAVSLRKQIAAKRFFLHPMVLRTALAIGATAIILINKDEDKVVTIDSESGVNSFSVPTSAPQH
ncbi:MAG TPA: hypothetical protein VF412_00745 [Bdellovibrio sp.]|uniref:hypothetical protein n=1 Tax=Bdellovibrio sp. TaxID=28201 RepID=UPI002EDEEAD1